MKRLTWRWLFWATCWVAQPEPASDRTAEFVEPYLKTKQIPGCAVMVRHEGKSVLCAGYGIANLEHRVRVTPETVFQSGSLGKQFTAMGVMLLAKEGKLALTDPISKHLSVPETWKGITIRHLLNHTSGMGDYPEDFSLTRDYTEQELLRMVTAQPLAATPGEKWNYSNLGYVTLGILIHKVTGEPYSDFLSRRIFQPLGMTSSRVINESDIIPHRAAGYRLREGVLKNQDWVAPSINTTADGSLYLTAQDMTKWAECLDEEKLIGHAGYEEMWAPATLNDGATAAYGYGWSIGKTRSGQRVLEHGGAWQGFASYIARYPDERLTVVVFCNRAGASARYIGQRVAALSVPELAPPARFRARSAPEILRQYAGAYRMEDRFTIVVEAEADHLETTWLGEKILMMPESDTAFFEQDSDRTFRFVTDGQGEVTALKIFVPEELTLKRIGSAKRK